MGKYVLSDKLCWVDVEKNKLLHLSHSRHKIKSQMDYKYKHERQNNKF